MKKTYKKTMDDWLQYMEDFEVKNPKQFTYEKYCLILDKAKLRTHIIHANKIREQTLKLLGKKKQEAYDLFVKFLNDRDVFGIGNSSDEFRALYESIDNALDLIEKKLPKPMKMKLDIENIKKLYR